MLRFGRALVCALAVALAAVGPKALASGAPKLPAVQLVTAPMVSPAAAWTFYGTATTHTVGPGAWTTTPPEYVALARSLSQNGRLSATAFTQNVFDYVRNNIAIEFHFGLAKGGRGALIDQSGTAFDQAELMMKLLRAGVALNSGYSSINPTYQVGTISPTPTQFGQWSGFITGLNQASQTFTVNAQSACQFLADGGIPATVNGSSTCSAVSGNLTSITLGHIWISANGNLYDPAFKSHTFKTGVNLATAAGCVAPTCASTLTTVVMAGATTGTIGTANAPTVQSLNEAAAATQMTTYAQNVEAYIKANAPSAQLDDIVGGARIDPTYQPTVGASLPYTSSSQYTWSGDIPDQFRSKLNITYNGMSVLFYSDDISSRRVRLWGTGIAGTSSYIFVDDTMVSTLACPSTCAGFLLSSLNLAAQHPYAAGTFANQTITPTIAEPATIIQSWGESSPSTVSFFTALQTVDPTFWTFNAAAPINSCQGAQGAAQGGGVGTTGANACRADEQPTLVALLQAQRSAANAMVGAMSGAPIVTHHTLGVLSTADDALSPSLNNPMYTAGPEYMTSSVAAVSIDSTSGTSAASAAAFETSSLVYGTLEGVIGQQTQDSPDPVSGASGLVQENRLGARFAYVSSANMAATLPSLVGFNVGVGALVPGDPVMSTLLQNAATSQSYSFILPTATTIATGGTNPITGQPNAAPTVSVLGFGANGLSYLNNFVFKGGGATAEPDPAASVRRTAKAAETGKAKKYLSVDLGSGDLTLKPPPDIVTGVGDFPYSLPFQRTYQSGAGSLEVATAAAPFDGNDGSALLGWAWQGPDQDDYARLGAGWTHNYQISARISSDGLKAFGQDDALDASSAIAAVYSLTNLLTSPSVNQRYASFMAAYWLGTKLVDNTITVSKLPGKEVFQQLPDGTTFNPPPGSAASLAQAGARAGPISYSNGLLANLLRYDYSPVTLTYTGSDGSTISFNYASALNATSAGSPVTIADPAFKAVQWKFPDGTQVNFNYTMYTWEPGANASVTTTSYYYLTGVSNSFGRQLNFSTTSTSYTIPANGGPPNQPSGDVGWVITKVTDETAQRSATYALSNCAPVYVANPVSYPTGYTPFTTRLGCNTFTAATPDGATSTYNYAASNVGSNYVSPDPAVIERAPYRLRQWFTPSNTGTAYETIAYDALYRAATVTDILNRVSQYYVNAVFPSDWWKHTDVIDPMLYTSSSWFDRFKNQMQTLSPIVGRIKTYAYDGLNRRVLAVDPLHNCVATTYDIRSNATATARYPAGTCTVNGWAATLAAGATGAITTSATFPEVGVYPCAHPANCNEPLSETDGRGNTTAYTFNSTTGQLAEILKPADANGYQPESDLAYAVQSGLGVSLLTQKTDWISRSPTVTQLVTTYAYNASNKFVLQTATVAGTSSGNLTSTFTFDNGVAGPGNLTGVQSPRTDLTATTNYTWDFNRRLTMEISTNPTSGLVGPATQYKYDVDGENYEIDKGTATSGSGAGFVPQEVSTFAFDQVGNKIQSLVLNGIAAPALTMTQYGYDADDRPLCTAVRMNAAAYSALSATPVSGSSVASVLPTSACTLSTQGPPLSPDPITQLTYDADGEKTIETRGFGTSLAEAYATYGYTLNGKESQVVDANCNATALTYDGFDRLAQQNFPLTARTACPTVNAADPSDYEAYTYDNNDNLTALRRRDTTTMNYCFDNLNREIRKDFPGTITACSATSVTGSVFTTYDLMSRKLAVDYNSPTGPGVSYTYDNAGRLLTEATSVGTLAYAYDGADNRTQITWPDGYFAAYAYDYLNHVSLVGENGLATTLATPSYDSLGRRMGLARGNGAATTYLYDKADRLSSLTQTFAGASEIQTLSYSPASQLLGVVGSNPAFDWQASAGSTRNNTANGLNQDAGIAALSGGYDGRGNETFDGTRSFSYDPENRLTGDTVGGTSKITLAYDPLGRLQSTVSPAGTTQFLYAGDELVGEYNGAMVLDRYVPGPGTDEPLVWYQGSGTATKVWLHADHQGSIIAQSGTTGAIAQTFLYDPYGVPQAWGGSRFAYTGQIAIPEAQLYHYKARAYDPAAGWFLQTDPVGYKDNLHLYAYVGGDPVGRNDPTGTFGEGMDAKIDTGVAFTNGLSSLQDVLEEQLFAEYATASSASAPSPNEAPVPLMGPDGKTPVRNVFGDVVMKPSSASIEEISAFGRAQAAKGPLAVDLGEAQFRQNGKFDFQRENGVFHPEFRDFATIAIGVYNSAAGVPINSTLRIENTYAGLFSKFSPRDPMSKSFTNLPARNVYNTAIGYTLNIANGVHR
jgi:RHS repeat-associated protein